MIYKITRHRLKPASKQQKQPPQKLSFLLLTVTSRERRRRMKALENWTQECLLQQFGSSRYRHTEPAAFFSANFFEATSPSDDFFDKSFRDSCSLLFFMRTVSNDGQDVRKRRSMPLGTKFLCFLRSLTLETGTPRNFAKKGPK